MRVFSFRVLGTNLVVMAKHNPHCIHSGWKADVETVFGPKAVDYEAKNKDKMEGHLLSQLNKKNAITVKL